MSYQVLLVYFKIQENSRMHIEEGNKGRGLILYGKDMRNEYRKTQVKEKLEQRAEDTEQLSYDDGNECRYRQSCVILH